jgi:streptogramin lyase
VNGDAGDPPIGMTNGPDGNVWMTGLNLKANVERDAITYIVTGTVDFGRYHQHETPVFVSGSTYQSRGIASDGTNIWYGANGTTDAAGSYLAEMSTSFAPVASYLVPGGSTITAVAEGPSNSIWFSACDGTAGTEVGTVSNGALVLYPVTNTTNCLEDLTLGPDGELWYITTSSPYIVGKISTTGTVTTYKLPASYDKGVLGLSDLVSANGAMWESLPELKAIAELTTGRPSARREKAPEPVPRASER